MREMYEKEVRRTEDYYKKMLEDMRKEHALALKYALAEWPDMKHVLENGDVELSIESCKLNSLSPEKYIRFLLDKLKGSDDQMDKTTLLPCYCSL